MTLPPVLLLLLGRDSKKELTSFLTNAMMTIRYGQENSQKIEMTKANGKTFSDQKFQKFGFDKKKNKNFFCE